MFLWSRLYKSPFSGKVQNPQVQSPKIAQRIKKFDFFYGKRAELRVLIRMNVLIHIWNTSTLSDVFLKLPL